MSIYECQDLREVFRDFFSKVYKIKYFKIVYTVEFYDERKSPYGSKD